MISLVLDGATPGGTRILRHSVDPSSLAAVAQALERIHTGRGVATDADPFERLIRLMVAQCARQQVLTLGAYILYPKGDAELTSNDQQQH